MTENKGLVRLVSKYAPRHLDEIYGQDAFVAYFKSVVNRPLEAYRNYIIAGEYGCGKTSGVRAFARDFLKVEDIFNTPNYVEVDSADQNIITDFNSFKAYLFQRVQGWKIVVIDEAHLIPSETAQKFLKPLEDFNGQIIFFFVTTDFDKIPETIKSRCLSFMINSFSQTQLAEYLDIILGKEGVKLQAGTKQAIIFTSKGHMRDLLNQAQIALFQGEEFYLKTYSRLNNAVEAFFRTKDSKCIEDMVHTPFEVLNRALEFYLLENIIKKRGIFKQGDIPKLFLFWVRMKRFIKSENDYYSFLYAFHEYLSQFERV